MTYDTKPLTGEEAAYLEARINEYAESVILPEPGLPPAERLVFKAEDGEGNTVAGCIVNIHQWGRAVLAVLWVDERFRRQGLGSMLIREAERAAREKDCYYLCLGTLDFQARELYEKHGFTVFTATEDFPRGHRGWSLSKRLDRDAAPYVPQNNSAVGRFGIKRGDKEDAAIICGGLDRYCDSFAPENHDEITLSRKLTDKDGRLIAGVDAFIDCWDGCDLSALWVEEPYRRQGLGSRLLHEIEREAKENGAYLMMTAAGDWNVDFFKKQGYTVRGVLEDYPKGWCSYELQKRL